MLATSMGAAAAAAGLSARSRAAQDIAAGLIVRKGEPLNAETPVDRLDTYLTPNDRFFVRSHHRRPNVQKDAPVEIGGLVSRSLQFTLAEIEKREQLTIPAVLQCSGNGRMNWRAA
jgi:DMSO/TMAO reductase YedYZ molybdopterin-dependent catalytic subunit